MFVQLVSSGDYDAHPKKLTKTTFKQTTYA